MFVEDLETFTKHDCVGVAKASPPAPVRRGVIHVIARGQGEQKAQALLNALIQWDNAGAIVKGLRGHGSTHEIWLRNADDSRIHDAIADLYLAGFDVTTKIEDHA